MGHEEVLLKIKERSKLLLFMSVDISGSTAYKNRHFEESGTSFQPWLGLFDSFYEVFSKYLHKHIDIHAKTDKFSSCEMALPSLWKSLGDELIFTATLKEACAAGLYVRSFMDATREYSDFLKKKYSESPDIGAHGSAWLAGFPIMNSEIKIDGQRDYIGPSIDIGFRISKFSTYRRFILSVDLAWLLLEWAKENRDTLFHFFYNGKEKMKGVVNEKPYPIVWIDQQNGKDFTEDEKLIKQGTPPEEDLTKFCSNYIKENSPYLMIPFIADETNETFSKIEGNYIKSFKQYLEICEDPVIEEEASPKGKDDISSYLKELKPTK